MRVAFYVSMFTFLLLFGVLYWLRTRIASQQDRLEDLEAELDDRLVELRDLQKNRA
jgi:hypothetical protein